MGRKKKSSNSVNCNDKQQLRSPPKADKVVPTENTFATLNIFDRLNKFFIQTSDYFNEEITIEYNFRPREVFVNGLCLVCSEVSQPEMTCDSCKMVSYCSEKHRKENYTKHKTLCMALTQVVRTQNEIELNQKYTPEEYRNHRIKQIELVGNMMQRPLELWEREIILYPRICRICYKFCDNFCTECGIECLCSFEEHSHKHMRWCQSFKVFRKTVQLQRKYGNVKPSLPNITSKEAKKLLNSFDEVIAQLIGGLKLYEDLDSYNYAMLSHLSSVPLTALHTFQETCGKDWNMRHKLRIHIIGAEFEFECADLRFWEKMFLHFLPALKELTLVFVGPELQAPKFLLDALSTIQLCSNCSAKKKSIKVEFHAGRLYHEAKTSCDPDLICLFNPGLYRQTGFSARDTWPETIIKFCKYKVPVVVTSYTEYEIPKDIQRIQSTCSVKILMSARRNAFASLKPDRNFVSDHIDPLIFKNYFITVLCGI